MVVVVVVVGGGGGGGGGVVVVVVKYFRPKPSKNFVFSGIFVPLGEETLVFNDVFCTLAASRTKLVQNTAIYRTF